MSSLSAAAAARPAEPALFNRLIDDAAVFPPGLAPLPDAVVGHREHLRRPYAALLGPLLVPAAAVPALVELVPPGADALRVGVIARPGTPLATVTDALLLLAGAPQLPLAAVEVGWTPEWRELEVGDVPLVLEVPRGSDQRRALAEIAAESGDDGVLLAKFRTGSTPTWDWPDEAELAGFLHAAVAAGVGFKLTGGLHHAVRGAYRSAGAAEEQHGLLNVLCAVRRALDGEDAESLVPVLATRDPGSLVTEVTGMGREDAATVRASFTAFGCCGVTDPIGELSELNLIKETL